MKLNLDAHADKYVLEVCIILCKVVKEYYHTTASVLFY